MVKFRVGDVVRVLSWEEIVKRSMPHCGNESSRMFNNPGAYWLFNAIMRKACGHSFTVREAGTTFRAGPQEQVLGLASDAHPEAPSYAPITNFMVELAGSSKYPTNRGGYGKVQKG